MPPACSTQRSVPLLSPPPSPAVGRSPPLSGGAGAAAEHAFVQQPPPPIQTYHAQTILSEDLMSTVAQAGSDASGSDESWHEEPLDVLAGMASVPEGDENDALSSHPSSAGENKNEEPAWEANWCRCPRGCHCAGDGDCCYCERCYHEGTWCKCDCRGCRAHDLAGEAEAPPPPDLPTPPPLAFSSPSPGSHPPPPPTPPLPWVQWRRAWSRRRDLQSLHKAAASEHSCEVLAGWGVESGSSGRSKASTRGTGG